MVVASNLLVQHARRAAVVRPSLALIPAVCSASMVVSSTLLNRLGNNRRGFATATASDEDFANYSRDAKQEKSSNADGKSSAQGGEGITMQSNESS